MKALQYYGPRDIRYAGMDDPKLQSDRDAIVKVDRCSICGSDLHIYHGHGFSEDIGFCVGHESVGEIVEVGRSVTRLKPGDKVILSAAVGCGACASCLRGDVIHCATQSGSCYGLSARLQGSQAEAVRVPAADFNATKIPDGISLDQALMMTDAMATAWFGARNADIASGRTVAVVGLGPIGLMAVDSAFVLGAARVFAIDPVAERRALAAQSGAIALHPNTAAEEIEAATGGRMCESVVEAVGLSETIRLSLKLAGRRASVSVIGVAQDKRFDFPMSKAFGAGLTFRIGTCSVPETWPELVPLIQAGRLKPERYISHRLPLSEGTRAYALSDDKREGALKLVLTP